MNSKDILERFKELNNNNEISCTEEELNYFLMCGLLIKSKNNYINRDNVEIKIDLIKTKTQEFDMNFSGIIDKASELSKTHNVKRIYFMSQRCYNNYKEKGLIYTKNNQEFYNFNEGESWLVYVIS